MQLLPPLSSNGNFNTSGIKIQVNEVLTVTTTDKKDTYTLYERATKHPEVEFEKDPLDQRYLHVMVNGYLVPLKVTLGHLYERLTADLAVVEVYGSEAARKTFFEDADNPTELRKAKLNQEQTAIRRLGQENPRLVADWVHRYLTSAKDLYTFAKESKEKGDWVWPDCIGACVAQELDLWQRLAWEYKQHNEEVERQKYETEVREKQESIAKAVDDLASRVKWTIEAIRSCNATIKNDEVVLYATDPNARHATKETHFLTYLMDQLNVGPKGATRGWINQHLDTLRIHKDPITGNPIMGTYHSGRNSTPDGVRAAIWQLIHAIQDN